MVEMTQAERPDLDKVTGPVELGPVKAWSYSALKVFEECPYRTYISRVKRIKEEAGPAATRGSEIHQQAEDYVRGTIADIPNTLKKFESSFKTLKDLFADAKVELEGEWAYTIDWEPTQWMAPDCWARIKLDAMVHEDKTSARVIDYKTGKRWGNEIAHGQQALIYAIGAFLRYPDLEFVQTELWYLDKDDTSRKDYTRDQAMAFFPKLHDRAVRMTTETDFTPTPSKSSCRWCSFRKGDNPECVWGVDS